MKPATASSALGDSEQALLEACSLGIEDCLAKLGSREKGLSAAEAEQERRQVGPNEVAIGKRGAFRRMVRRLVNPLVVQLLVIAGVSWIMGDLRSAIVVGGLLLVSLGLSSIQEERSGRAVEKLQAMVRTTVNVLRDGAEAEIPLREIVPGDVVVLDAGTLVPADIRLIATKDFFVSQSALTGESMPVEKSAAAAPPGDGRRWSSRTPASRAATCSPAAPGGSW